MQKSVWMTILLLIIFCKEKAFFFVSLLFSKDNRWDYEENPYGPSSHGKFLGVWWSKFSILQPRSRSPTRA